MFSFTFQLNFIDFLDLFMTQMIYPGCVEQIALNKWNLLIAGTDSLTLDFLLLLEKGRCKEGQCILGLSERIKWPSLQLKTSCSWLRSSRLEIAIHRLRILFSSLQDKIIPPTSRVVVTIKEHESYNSNDINNSSGSHHVS